MLFELVDRRSPLLADSLIIKLPSTISSILAKCQWYIGGLLRCLCSCFAGMAAISWPLALTHKECERRVSITYAHMLIGQEYSSNSHHFEYISDVSPWQRWMLLALKVKNRWQPRKVPFKGLEKMSSYLCREDRSRCKLSVIKVLIGCILTEYHWTYVLAERGLMLGDMSSNTKLM